jgi:uncharacterized membrane protein
MKPSHITTPRNLAECTFDVGYRSAELSDEPSWFESTVWSLVGIGAFFGLLACMLAYFDVLVR